MNENKTNINWLVELDLSNPYKNPYKIRKN